MTDLLERATRTTPTVDDRSGSLVVTGALAAAWTVVVGLTTVLVVVLVVWASDPRSGAGAVAAVRTALQAWLAAQHVPLAVPGGRIDIAPLGLTAGLALLLVRAGRSVARDAGVTGLGGVAAVAAAVAAPYAVLSALVTAGAATPTVRPTPVLALVWSLVIGATGAGAGAWRAVGPGAAPLRRLPREAAALLAGGAVAAGVLVVGGAVLGAGALVLHADGARAALAGLRPGAVGGVALLVVQVGLVPNAALWGVGYLAGPGFALGAGTSIGPFAVSPARLPALPLLAAVPTRPAGGAVLALLVLVVLSAGVLAGWTVARQLGAASALRAAAWGAGAGVAAGVGLVLLLALSGGSAGPEALRAVGPSAWKVGLLLAAELTPVSAAAAALTGVRLVRP